MSDNSEIRGYADEELSEHALRLRVADLRARVAELEAVCTKSPTEWCMEERADGNGGCGACALCCKEVREQRDAARAEVERLRADLLQIEVQVSSNENEPDEVLAVIGRIARAALAGRETP